jgi:prepilin-type N-terminal cleavage/methylation domain-containing protein
VTARRGFTLIEILIVIGIIALLATILLALFSRARTSSSDGVIKADLKQVAGEMELSYSANYDYGPSYVSAVCPTSSNPPDPIFYTDPEIKSMIVAVNAANGGKNVTCAAGGVTMNSAQTWAAAAPLKGSDPVNGPFWCVDSAGHNKISYIDGGGIFYTLASQLIQVAHAAPVSQSHPNLGGGLNPAVCP